MRLALALGCLAATSLQLAAAEVPLADFARHAQYQDVKLSPDGQHLAATAIVNGQTALALVSVADMKPKLLRPRAGDDVIDFDWVGPDRVMYSEGIHIGGIDRPIETGELYTVKADGGGAAVLFGIRAGGEGHTASHIQQVTAEAAAGVLIAPLRDDANHALIASYAWNGPGHSANTLGVHPEAYRIDLRDGRKALIATSPMRNAEFLADHNGAIRFAYGIDNDQVRRVWYHDAQGGDWALLHDDSKQKERFEPVMFDRTNEAVYVICDGANRIGGVCRWDAKTRKQDLLWSAKDSATIDLMPTFDGLDAFAVRTSQGRPAVALLDKSASEATLLVSLMQQFAGENIVITSASRDGKRVVFLAHADTDPGVFYLYDAEKKKATALFQRRPWINPEQMSTMEPVELKARDGLMLHGYLTRPSGKQATKQWPLIVLVHGGPNRHDEWGFNDEVQLLASRGYVVLQVNFRGSDGYGDAFMRAGYKEWGGKMQDDVTDATRWAIEQGIADPKRICIFGTSYGGYAALEGAVKEPDLYKCAIGNAGIYDLRLMYARGDSTQTSRSENGLKLLIGENPEQLWDRSPIAHLDKLKAAVMLIAGGADTRVPSVQAENLHNALNQRKVEHEWIYERTEGHGFYTLEHATQMYEKILSFLDKNIGSAAVQTAAK